MQQKNVNQIKIRCKKYLDEEEINIQKEKDLQLKRRKICKII